MVLIIVIASLPAMCFKSTIVVVPPGGEVKTIGPQFWDIVFGCYLIGVISFGLFWAEYKFGDNKKKKAQ